MAGKATGKYYAQFYKAKKSPFKVKKIKTVKHIVAIAAAVAVIAAAVVVWQVNRINEASFMEVSASRQSLSDVAVYPRIVNHDVPVESSVIPQNLISLNTVPNGESVYLRADAAEAFIEMVNAMSEDGLGIVPVSGYLSYEQQGEALLLGRDKYIAEGATAEQAEKLAAENYPAPGEDEAQLGTSVDISTDISAVNQFSVTDQCQWINTHAHEYGFIVRYTANKQSVTGVAAKPWHLRYVGKDAAEYMKRSGMCLEEYVKAVKQDNPNAVQED